METPNEQAAHGQQPETPKKKVWIAPVVEVISTQSVEGARVHGTFETLAHDTPRTDFYSLDSHQFS